MKFTLILQSSSIGSDNNKLNTLERKARFSSHLISIEKSTITIIHVQFGTICMELLEITKEETGEPEYSSRRKSNMWRYCPVAFNVKLGSSTTENCFQGAQTKLLEYLPQSLPEASSIHPSQYCNILPSDSVNCYRKYSLLKSRSRGNMCWFSRSRLGYFCLSLFYPNHRICLMYSTILVLPFSPQFVPLEVPESQAPNIFQVLLLPRKRNSNLFGSNWFHSEQDFVASCGVTSSVGKSGRRWIAKNMGVGGSIVAQLWTPEIRFVSAEARHNATGRKIIHTVFQWIRISNVHHSDFSLHGNEESETRPRNWRLHYWRICRRRQDSHGYRDLNVDTSKLSDTPRYEAGSLRDVKPSNQHCRTRIVQTLPLGYSWDGSTNTNDN